MERHWEELSREARELRAQAERLDEQVREEVEQEKTRRTIYDYMEALRSSFSTLRDSTSCNTRCNLALLGKVLERWGDIYDNYDKGRDLNGVLLEEFTKLSLQAYDYIEIYSKGIDETRFSDAEIVGLRAKDSWWGKLGNYMSSYNEHRIPCGEFISYPHALGRLNYLIGELDGEDRLEDSLDDYLEALELWHDVWSRDYIEKHISQRTRDRFHALTKRLGDYIYHYKDETVLPDSIHGKAVRELVKWGHMSNRGCPHCSGTCSRRPDSAPERCCHE